jgi:hypothetical protein
MENIKIVKEMGMENWMRNIEFIKENGKMT